LLYLLLFVTSQRRHLHLQLLNLTLVARPSLL
jgi:hypothetical protein